MPESTSPRPCAVVTGGARRLGAAMVRDLVAAGWQVVAQYHASDAEAHGLAEELAPHVRLVELDLARADAAEHLFAGVSAPGLLVNNASRFVADDLADFEPHEWDAAFAVNVRAPALLTQAFARVAPQGAVIVNLLDAKLANPNTDYFSYTIAKSALAGLTEIAARRLAGQGIRVCAIAPAMVLPSPDMADFERRHAMTALGRGVTVEEVTATLRYILATPTLTGVTVTLDGGQRFLGLQRDVAYL